MAQGIQIRSTLLLAPLAIAALRCAPQAQPTPVAPQISAEQKAANEAMIHKFQNCYALKPGAPKEVKDYWERCLTEKQERIEDAIRFYWFEKLPPHFTDNYDHPRLYSLTDGSTGRPDSLRIVQITGDHDFIGTLGLPGYPDAKKETVWVTGVNTSYYTDGEKLHGAVLRVDGRRQYESVLGQRTIKLLRDFPIYQYIEEVPLSVAAQGRTHRAKCSEDRWSGRCTTPVEAQEEADEHNANRHQIYEHKTSTPATVVKCYGY